MTLDRGCKPTIKGHFCSLLISNIFSYPLFLLSTFDPLQQILQNINTQTFSNENTLTFVSMVST